MRSFSLIGALTLGVSLCTTSLWAADFRVINNANENLALACSTEGGAGSVGTVSHGASADFACDGTFRIQRVGGTGYTIPFDCPSGQVKQIELTTDSGATDLIQTQSCHPQIVE